MVDKEKVRHKIQLIEANIGKLKQIKQCSFQEFIQDFRNVEAAKHLLQVNVEAMIDIANHIIARNRWTTPETSADSFKLLEKHGFLTSEEVTLFNQMVKFRNRVVHLYHTVDDVEIYKILEGHLVDFDLFIKAIVGKVI